MTTNEILAGLELRLPEHTIELVTMTKNNGFEREGVTIKSPGVKISPVIYLDGFEEDDPYVVEKIITIHKAHSFIDGEAVGDFLCDFETVREYITYILLNKDLNIKLLEKVPYRDYLDMVLIPVIIFRLTEVMQ